MDQRKVTGDQLFEMLEMPGAKMCSTLSKIGKSSRVTVLSTDSYTDSLQHHYYRVFYIREPYVIEGEQKQMFGV